MSPRNEYLPSQTVQKYFNFINAHSIELLINHINKTIGEHLNDPDAAKCYSSIVNALILDNINPVVDNISQLDKSDLAAIIQELPQHCWLLLDQEISNLNTMVSS